MKKTIVIAILICLFYMFLVYSGVFRNNSDPLAVSRYYYECLRNWEWFLTYPIYKKTYFNYSRDIQDYKQHKIYLVKKIDFSLLSISQKNAFVLAKISYKDNSVITGIIELEMVDRDWKMLGVKYD